MPDSWDRGVEYQFTIFDRPCHACLAGCGLDHINPFYRMANLGYWVRSDRTGKGIASMAARLVARVGFRELGPRRIEIVAGVENVTSRRTAVKDGARFEGILRHRIKLGDGNIDAAMNSLLPKDLQEENG